MTNFDDPRTVQLHLSGLVRRLSVPEFGIALGLYTEEFMDENDLDTFRRHIHYSLSKYWYALVPGSATYDPNRSKASALSPFLRYLYAILAHTLTGRQESTSDVNTHDTYFLWSMANGHVLNLAYFIALAIRHQMEQQRRGIISIGPYVTRLAWHFGLLNTVAQSSSLTLIGQMSPQGILSMLNMRMIEKHQGTHSPKYRFTQSAEERDPEDITDDVPPRHEDPPSQPPPSSRLIHAAASYANISERLTRFEQQFFAGSALLDMYAKFGKIELGIIVFDEMPIKSVVSWTAIITGLVHGGYYKKGLVYLSEMRKSGVEYDSYTLAIVLKACACLGALNFGREIHTHTVKRGFNDTSYVANSLSTMYNKCGKLDYGLRLFDKMNTRDVVSWTSIITTYVQMREDVNAIEAFTRMQEAGVSPNEFTFAAVIASCSGLVRISWGEQLHAHVLRSGLADTLSVANSLMTMYSKCGQISSAAMVFHGMSRRDTISWSTIIAVYSQGGYGEEAFEHLSWMRKEGPKPAQFAFASVLSVCGNMAILEQGRQLHAHVLSIGLEQEEMIQSALVNMYSKCGCIKDAEKVFNEAENYNIVTWTAMINGYADHGYIHETINLFKMLSKVGLKPDSVTFIGLLTACSHAGLAGLGFHYFNLMSSKYQIRPSKEHYGCMIDLLCRAGRLTEAEEMIKSMPFHRDDVVWSTLLRACRVQGNVDCGERAAEKLPEMDPNCAGTHITLANIYSAKGKWREAADVRKMMRTKGVMKEPGWSWIKVKDRVSVFVAGERSYPEGEEIYGMLDLLASRVDISVQELGSLLDLED
ncbi:hypothetical protein GOBAR_AA10512 [Gossypium barbadense]|uniref:Pentatricopeptide repeat-containing protein n=1 Tax=Gossypium barbadense TaxID=3634 RepID=A0A2P5Y3G8_GOSBA|nr:hypothetical protein GOBAR_AA10512 [Gossypium barbadense]